MLDCYPVSLDSSEEDDFWVHGMLDRHGVRDDGAAVPNLSPELAVTNLDPETLLIDGGLAFGKPELLATRAHLRLVFPTELVEAL